MDPIKIFDAQFMRAGDGYLFYSWKNSEGKPVTAAEYARLTGDWRRHAGWGRIAAIVLIAPVIVIATIAASIALDLPPWVPLAVGLAVTIGAFLPMLSAGYAPHRLVRDRDAVAPPRDPAAVMRQHRTAISWWYLFYMASLAGWLLFSPFWQSAESWPRWFATVSGMFLLPAALWVATRKLLDARR